MSYEEALKSWEKIFILVMESTDDPVYRKAEEVINKESTQKLIKSLIEEEVYLPYAIGGYIVTMIIEAQGPEKLEKLSLDEMGERIDDFWNRYLKKPTRAFTTKNGLPPVDQESLRVSCKFIKKNEKF